MRAGMGAHFRLPLYSRLDWDQLLADLDGVVLVAAGARKGVDSRLFLWPERAAMIIGGEAGGITARAMQEASEFVHISMKPGVESLNAAMAAAILLYSALDRENPESGERYI